MKKKNKERTIILFSSIEEFISKVKLEISSQCPSYFQRVDIFSQNYLCKPNPTTTTPVDLSYIDEDEEFNFINTNTNLVNTTEHTVYIVRREPILFC
mgnify:CR=1 FL=1